jgi:peroxiredoxin
MKTGQKLVYAAFVALLINTFIASHPIRVLAAELAAIAASANEVKPLQTGELAPRFTVRTVDDEPFVFDPENLDAPAILITFRGGWCPYCNMHLSELRNVVPELRGKGIDVYFISGDRPELLYASLKRETQDEIDGLGYTILSDANIEAARALGIAFKAAESTIAGREAKGQDIDGSSMKNHGVLSVPAVYVIDATGMVTYSFVEPDYKIRLPAEDLLKAASKVAD